MNKQKIVAEIKAFALMLLIITSMRSALADWNDVPTGSMKPTIQEGDRVVVNKLAYDLKIPFTSIRVAQWDDPKRGDIVVLFSPEDGTRLVKRVVAVPGDRVELLDNQLFVNSMPAPLSADSIRLSDPNQGETVIHDEILDGRKHKVMLTPSRGDLSTWGPAIVPSDHYFVMGDNRDNSNDSRKIGPVERKRIVGKATAVAFSLDRGHYFVPRMSRFFKGLE